MPTPPITRRSALKRAAAAGFAAPFVYRAHAGTAAPSETLRHVSVGAGGMALSDIKSLTPNKHLKLVAAADVDATRAAALKTMFPDVTIYTDWREMFDKETFDSANVSVPDHMHAAPTMRALKAGKSVYTQKPLTQTIYEARQLTLAAKDAKAATQMGIQIHSSKEHRSVVATVRSGAIGKVKAVHSWSGKDWGDLSPLPAKSDPVPPTLNWDLWLGVAAARPYLGGGYYHPGNWRKRLDFGTGTFGDMGCHILDPVYGALGVKYPKAVRSTGDATTPTNWPLNVEVEYTFPGSAFTTDPVTLTWYNGDRRPPAAVTKLIGDRKLEYQGSIYIGTDGVMYSPYIGMPVLIAAAAGKTVVEVPGDNHYYQWIDAARGAGTATAPFAYAGPLTEMVLVGCLALRFPKTTLEWDGEAMKVTNVPAANQFVSRTYRHGWDEKGLS